MVGIELLFLILQSAIAVFFFYMVLAFVTGAPFVPTKNDSAASMITLAQITPGAVVYDMGSGNGKLLARAQRAGARAIGYEINPFLVFLSNIIHPGTRTYWKNFWRAPIRDANIVFVYLLPWRMERLAAKLQRECRRGTLIVSNSFIFPGWKIIRKDETHHIYVFRV